MTKFLITKADGSPIKSKIHAVQFLNKQGIDKELLIEENGQFFYEDLATEEAPKVVEEIKEEVKDCSPSQPSPTGAGVELFPVTWETPVYDKNNEKTVLIIPGTDIKATINTKHPGGQIRPTSAFEIAIGQENFIMSLDLVSKLFKVREAK